MSLLLVSVYPYFVFWLIWCFGLCHMQNCNIVIYIYIIKYPESQMCSRWLVQYLHTVVSGFRRFHKNIMYHSWSNEVALNMATRTSFSYLLARILTICASYRIKTHKHNFADCMGSLPLHGSRKISSNSCKLIPFFFINEKKRAQFLWIIPGFSDSSS